jgi:hypothetical protein
VRQVTELGCNMLSNLSERAWWLGSCAKTLMCSSVFGDQRYCKFKMPSADMWLLWDQSAATNHPRLANPAPWALQPDPKLRDVSEPNWKGSVDGSLSQRDSKSRIERWLASRVLAVLGRWWSDLTKT